MATKTKKKSAPSGFASDAALQSLVRFGPQITALKQLGDEAVQTYQGTIHSADAAAGATQAAIASAAPAVRDIYGRAGLNGVAAGTLANEHLQGIAGGTPGVDAIKAGAANESRAVAAALGQQQAAALTDLQSRGVRAREGAQYATENARSSLIDALTKIGQQQTALTGEKGAFEASVISGLQAAQSKQDFTASQNEANRSTSLLTAGVDSTGQVIPGGKADKPAKTKTSAANKGRLPGGAKLRTTDAHAALIDKLQTTAQLAKEYRRANPRATRAEVAAALMSGDPGGTIHDTKTGKVELNADGTERKNPAIPAQGEFLSSLALDLLFDGHVSRKNVVGDPAAGYAGLHQRGYSVKALGLPGPLPRDQANVQTSSRSADQAVAKALAELLGKKR